MAHDYGTEIEAGQYCELESEPTVSSWSKVNRGTDVSDRESGGEEEDPIPPVSCLLSIAQISLLWRPLT